MRLSPLSVILFPRSQGFDLNEKKTTRYVLLPPTNVWNIDSPGTGVSFLLSASVQPSGRTPLVKPASRGARGAGRPAMKVLDSLGEDDAKLVEMTDEQRLRLHAEEPGVRVVPVVEARPLWLRDRLRSTLAAPSAVGIPREFEVVVTDAISGKPVRQAQVIAFLNRKERSGQKNMTNAKGVAKFRFLSSTKKLDTILADALHTYWPMHISQDGPASLEDGKEHGVRCETGRRRAHFLG
jgi:minor extracellular protease Epr